MTGEPTLQPILSLVCLSRESGRARIDLIDKLPAEGALADAPRGQGDTELLFCFNDHTLHGLTVQVTHLRCPALACSVMASVMAALLHTVVMRWHTCQPTRICGDVVSGAPHIFENVIHIV